MFKGTNPNNTLPRKAHPMRQYYRVEIARCIAHGTYYVRAANIPEAHDKALKAEMLVAKEQGTTLHLSQMPYVTSVSYFCDNFAVLT